MIICIPTSPGGNIEIRRVALRTWPGSAADRETGRAKPVVGFERGTSVGARLSPAAPAADPPL